MEKDNLKIWNQVSRPPKSALKTIGGGRLKGMTDINPQWRYKKMTEMFGPCGIGWKYELVDKQLESVKNGEIIIFVTVNLYIRQSATKWSEPIPGTGGSKLVSKENRGMYANDEAMKMAITDALGTAMKMLGVAAEIYEGNYDGSKYRDVKDSKPIKKQLSDNSQDSKKKGKLTVLSKMDKMLNDVVYTWRTGEYNGHAYSGWYPPKELRASRNNPDGLEVYKTDAEMAQAISDHGSDKDSEQIIIDPNDVPFYS